MQKWEYNIVSTSTRSLTSEELNKYGDAGWELSAVSSETKVTQFPGASNTTRVEFTQYLFKRPKQEVL